MKYFYYLTISMALLFQHQLQAQACNGLILSDDYANPTAWTSGGTALVPGGLTPGTLSVANQQLEFRQFRGRQTFRLYQDMGCTLLSSDRFSLELKLRVLGPLPAENGATVVALSETSDHWQGNVAGSTNNNMNDAILIGLGDPLGANNEIGLFFQGKKDHVVGPAERIPINPNIDYFIRLERTHKDSLQFSIYSDSSRTQHIANSPKTVAIDSTIGNLSYVQHGIGTTSSQNRTINMNLDDLLINYVSPNTLEEQQSLENILRIFPNPFRDQLKLDLLEPVDRLLLTNSIGQLVEDRQFQQQGLSNWDVSDLAEGIYFLTIEKDGRRYHQKLLKQ